MSLLQILNESARTGNRTRLTSLATTYSTDKLPTLVYYFNNLYFDDPIILIPTISIVMLKGNGTRSKTNKVAEVKHIAIPMIKRLMLMVLLVSILKRYGPEENRTHVCSV